MQSKFRVGIIKVDWGLINGRFTWTWMLGGLTVVGLSIGAVCYGNTRWTYQVN